MDIVLYNNLSDPDTLNKNISVVDTLTGSLKNDCSIENPTIIIEHSGMINANYAYISEFGRYYYINNQTILSNNIVRLDLSVDVLFTYKTQILGLSVIIDNSTSNPEYYLSSEIWRDKVKTSTDIINFSSGFNDNGEFILITAGG